MPEFTESTSARDLFSKYFLSLMGQTRQQSFWQLVFYYARPKPATSSSLPRFSFLPFSSSTYYFLVLPPSALFLFPFGVSPSVLSRSFPGVPGDLGDLGDRAPPALMPVELVARAIWFLRSSGNSCSHAYFLVRFCFFPMVTETISEVSIS
jgi:hypothetical protein